MNHWKSNVIFNDLHPLIHLYEIIRNEAKKCTFFGQNQSIFIMIDRMVNKKYILKISRRNFRIFIDRRESKFLDRILQNHSEFKISPAGPNYLVLFRDDITKWKPLEILSREMSSTVNSSLYDWKLFCTEIENKISISHKSWSRLHQYNFIVLLP